MDFVEVIRQGIALEQKLKNKTIKFLPTDWLKGKICPLCGMKPIRGCDYGKDYEEMYGCIGKDPNNYSPSPYIDIPDTEAQSQADIVRNLIGMLAYQRLA